MKQTLEKIKGYFEGGYNIGIKIAIFFGFVMIFGLVASTITDATGLTDYEGYNYAKGLWRAMGAPTLKSSYDMFFDNVPGTHEIVASITNWLSLILSVLILGILNNKKK